MDQACSIDLCIDPGTWQKHQGNTTTPRLEGLEFVLAPVPHLISKGLILRECGRRGQLGVRDKILDGKTMKTLTNKSL